MVDSIRMIQQMLAESRFVDAQKAAETELIKSEGSENIDLWELLFRSLQQQNKELPTEYLVNFIEKLIAVDIDRASKWLVQVKEDEKFRQRVLLIKILIAENKGHPEELYQHISNYQVLRWEKRTPTIPLSLDSLIEKYFMHDFNLKLQKLALDLLTYNFVASEKKIIELIVSCFEKSSQKGRREKLQGLLSILNDAEKLFSLEIYRNLIQVILGGISDKRDFKKLIEIVIYIEDFKLQVILLDFFSNQSWSDLTHDYSLILRQNKDYSFVYIEKYFSNLKHHFVKKSGHVLVDQNKTDENVDLSLENTKPDFYVNREVVEVSEQEKLLAQLLKYNEFSKEQLWDVASGFIQSEFYYAGLKACELMPLDHEDTISTLRCFYLKIICLSKLGDYRSVIDKCFEALMISENENDFLSFLYAKADAYIHLEDYSNAKEDLSHIVKIDERYRLAKEKLEKLNAI